jgi:hypothetical protein
MKISPSRLSVRQRILLPVIFFSTIFLPANTIRAQENIDVGKTGWDVKRPVMAGACDNGCRVDKRVDFGV